MKIVEKIIEKYYFILFNFVPYVVVFFMAFSVSSPLIIKKLDEDIAYLLKEKEEEEKKISNEIGKDEQR